MDPMTIIALGSLAISAISGIYNAYQTNKTNKENRDFVESTNADTYEHEKEALQTKVADAQKAGLSPLAALGSSGTQVTTPLQYQAQTPQMDVSQMLSSLTSLSNEYNSDKTRKEIAKLETDTTKKGFENSWKIAQLTARNTRQMALENRRSVEKIEDAKLKQQAIFQEQNLAIAMDGIKAQYDLANQKIDSENADRLYKSYMSTADSLKAFSNQSGVHIQFRVLPVTKDNEKNYYQALNEANQADCFDKINSGEEAVNKFLQTASPEEIASMYSHGKAHSKTNVDSDTFAGGLDILGTGGNVNRSYSDTRSFSDSNTDTYTKDANFQRNAYASNFPKDIVYWLPASSARHINYKSSLKK